ncbi:hypothetical protein [Gorillibacterium timonense]|uniref:hypothetical protein n=1 Tax=Gorillibacterium timonense TaxID=1689269 RepID=UPI00071C98CA|nr:hypothetical protein [Gorillibacterium timonense]
METFVRRIRFRVKAFSILLVVSMLLTVSIAVWQYSVGDVTGTEGMGDFYKGLLKGMQIGVFFGVFVAMLGFIIQYAKALRNETSMRKLYIEENDERNRLIHFQSISVSFYLIMGCVALAGGIAVFFQAVVAFTLFAVLLVMGLTLLLSWSYFTKRT